MEIRSLNIWQPMAITKDRKKEAIKPPDRPEQETKRNKKHDQPKSQAIDEYV